MRKIKLIIVIPFLFLIFASCEHQPDLSRYQEVCFTDQILPIFQSNCAMSGCHNGDEGNLGTYQGILDYGIKPGSASESKIYKAITATWLNPMPPSKPLNEEQRTLISLWINQGARNTICVSDSTPDTTQHHGLCFNQDVFPIISSYCAKSGCHDASSDKPLTNYNQVMNAGVTPGNIANSYIYQVIVNINIDPDNRMPPQGSSQLSNSQISILNQWIMEGATNDTTCVGCDTTNVTYTSTILPIINSSCLGCHSAVSPSGGISFSSYSDIHTNINALWTSINPGAVNIMPPSGSLSACKIKQIKIWKDAGSPQNK